MSMRPSSIGDAACGGQKIAQLKASSHGMPELSGRPIAAQFNYNQIIFRNSCNRREKERENLFKERIYRIFKETGFPVS